MTLFPINLTAAPLKCSTRNEKIPGFHRTTLRLQNEFIIEARFDSVRRKLHYGI